MNTEFDRHGALARAVAFAAYAHDGRTREGSALPCIVHPMETAAIAATMTNDPEVLAAAVLHGAMGECNVSETEIRVRFGKRVAQLVRAGAEEPDCGMPGSWQKTKLRTVNRLPAAPRDVMILALSDHLSSLRAIRRELAAQGSALWQRLGQSNPSMQHWFYASVGEALAPLADTDAHREYTALVKEIFG